MYKHDTIIFYECGVKEVDDVLHVGCDIVEVVDGNLQIGSSWIFGVWLNIGLSLPNSTIYLSRGSKKLNLPQCTYLGRG